MSDILTKNIVRFLQMELKKDGFYTGSIDGLRTRADGSRSNTDIGIEQALNNHNADFVLADNESDISEWTDEKRAVAYLQTQLNERDLYTGPVDGNLSQETQDAFGEYRSNVGSEFDKVASPAIRTDDPKSYHIKLPPDLRPSEPLTLKEKWYPGIRDAALQASSSRIYDSVTGIRALVLHGTAGGSSSGAASVIKAGNASFHWLVPDEDEAAHGDHVWATCHEARAAWHVRNGVSHPDLWDGHNKINHYSLGVEIVNRQDNQDPFSQFQVNAAAGITLYAWAKYPNFTDVISHAKLDPSRRTDPGANFPWEEFRHLILDKPQESFELLMEEPDQFGLNA